MMGNRIGRDVKDRWVWARVLQFVNPVREHGSIQTTSAALNLSKTGTLTKEKKNHEDFQRIIGDYDHVKYNLSRYKSQRSLLPREIHPSPFDSFSHSSRQEPQILAPSPRTVPSDLLFFSWSQPTSSLHRAADSPKTSSSVGPAHQGTLAGHL